MSNEILNKTHALNKTTFSFFNVSQSVLEENSFVQSLVDDSIHYQNYKFDFTVYGVVTSLNPLRMYTLHGKTSRYL